jgi:hypothetical protein
MENKSDISRRRFLKHTAAASAGVALTGGLAPAQVLGANDKIRVGVLGSGSRAQYVMELFSGWSPATTLASPYPTGPPRSAVSGCLAWWAE